MWMFLKVMLAMSAATSFVAVPTAYFSHHGQAQTEGQVSVHTATGTHASSHIDAHVAARGQANDSQAANTQVKVNPGGPASVPTRGGATNPVTAAKPNPLGSLITWGKVQSVGNGKIVLITKGQASESFTMTGNTHIVFISGGPIQADEMPNRAVSTLRPGDNVMLIARGGVAVTIVDRGGTNGPYLPLGGSRLAPGSMSTVSSVSSGSLSLSAGDR
jgi:hypothetical protein